jgi:hypothetical protein
MNHYEFDTTERSYRARARSQPPPPPMFTRESAERFRPYETTYHSRDERRRMENERFDYHSEPEILSSDDDDDDLNHFSGYKPDWEVYGERRPVRLI